MPLLYVVVTNGVRWHIYPVDKDHSKTLYHAEAVMGAITKQKFKVIHTAIPYEEWAHIHEKFGPLDINSACLSIDLDNSFTSESCFYLLRLWKHLVIGSEGLPLMKIEPPPTTSTSCWIPCIDLLKQDYTDKTPTGLLLNGGEEECSSWRGMYVTLAEWLSARGILDDECLDVDVTVYRRQRGKFTRQIGNGYIAPHANPQQLRDYTVRLLRLVAYKKSDVVVDEYKVCLEDKNTQ